VCSIERFVFSVSIRDDARQKERGNVENRGTLILRKRQTDEDKKKEDANTM